MAVEDLDIVGEWPTFQGKTLEQLIAQQSWFEGELDDEANVVWLQISGEWHRLYFDSEAVYWSTASSGPRLPEGDADAPDFPLNDLGAKHDLIGQAVTQVDGGWADQTSTVTFHFENGKALTFRNRFDTTTVRLEEAAPAT